MSSSAPLHTLRLQHAAAGAVDVEGCSRMAVCRDPGAETKGEQRG